MKKISFGSIEQASLLRKFTILFMLMSIIPIAILYYFYLELRDKGAIGITAANFSVTLFLVVLGVGVGYWAMRSVIQSLIQMSEANKKALEAFMGPEKIHEIAHEKNELAVIAQSFSVVTSRLEENIRNLEIAKKTLHSVLSRVGEGISNLQNIDKFLELIVETATEAFFGKYGVLMLTDRMNRDVYVSAVCGVKGAQKEKLKAKTSDDPFRAILVSGKPMIIEKIDHAQFDSPQMQMIFQPPILCAPLTLHENTIGILAVCGRKIERPFEEDEKNLIQNLALQTAVAVENSQLNEDAEKTYFETISALALAVDAKDRYSRGHLDRVAKYAVRIASKLHLTDQSVKILRDAARLHDVGKIGIPDEILLKPSQLTSQEMDLMKKHTEIGESIIRPIRSLRHICDIVRHHHEKLDGTGYPDGLKGDEISLMVRIISVSDVYDALTTDRPYRVKFSDHEARAILRSMKDHLDQAVVEALIATFQEEGK